MRKPPPESARWEAPSSGRFDSQGWWITGSSGKIICVSRVMQVDEFMIFQLFKESINFGSS